MPRRRLPARLYLRRSRDDRSSVWVILDGAKEIGTGASADDRTGAEKALQTHLAKSHRPPSGATRPEEFLISEVVAVYLREHAPTRPSAKHIGYLATPIIVWWGAKTLGEVNGRNCRSYVQWRTAQPVASSTKKKGRLVTAQTARDELIVLRAAINFFNREYGPLLAVPAVTLPPKAPPREDYFLSRDEVAKRIRAARCRPQSHHVARLILLILYSGTRPGAAMRLRWLPSTEGGWIDVDSEVIHRRAQQAPRNRKRQPPVRIHKNLLPHLRRWRRADMALGITQVIHYEGRRVNSVYESWRSVRAAAGSERKDGPHIMRHTAATLFMARGMDVAVIAGFLGMTINTLVNTYGHHHPQFQEDIAQATPKKQQNRKETR
jgi:integrase